MGTVKRLLSTLAGTGAVQAQAASALVPINNTIIGVQWEIDIAAPSTAINNIFELSLSSASGIGVGDQNPVLSTIQFRHVLTTSGDFVISQHLYVPLPDVPVVAGQFIYLHQLVENGKTPTAYAHVYYAR